MRLHSLLRLPHSVLELLQHTLQQLGQHDYSNALQEQKRSSPFPDSVESHSGGAVRQILLKLRRILLNRRWLALLGAFLLLAVIAGSLLSPPSWSSAPHSVKSQKDHLLYLIIPTTHPDTDLCKTVGTAAILGYSTPYLLNWAAEHDPSGQASDAQYRKIQRTRDALLRFGPDDESIVLLLDGPSAWFQLRAEVLLSRYYALTEEANERLSKTFGSKAVAEGHMSQRLVFSAQNNCRGGGGAHDRLPCSNAPPPPVSQHTDQNLRYLNVGSIMGPANQMRALLDHAAARAEHSSNHAADTQTIFEDVFSDQTIWRELMRLQSRSALQTVWASVMRMIGQGRTVLDAVPARHLAEIMDSDQSYEFGIGIDYSNTLGLSVSQGQIGESIDWITHNTTASSHQASSGSSSAPSLPADIAASTPPFWTTIGYGLPLEQAWEDVKLLASKATNSIPALITFSLSQNDTDPSPSSPSLQESGWTNLWPHPHACTLYQAQLSVPRLPLASVVDGTGVEHIFWNPETSRNRDGVKTFGEDWVDWKDLCPHDDEFWTV